MIRISFTGYVILGHELSERTVVNTFRDRLENLDIERSSAAVVPIVFVFVVSDDTACPLRGRESYSGRLGYPGNDLTGIEGENGRIRIHGVMVEYFRKVRRLEDGFREVRSERVFIRTTSKINRTSAPTAMLRKPKRIITWYISAPLLEERGSAGGMERNARWKSVGGSTIRTNVPWKASVSERNQSSQLPLKSNALSSSKAPFWYILGL